MNPLFMSYPSAIFKAGVGDDRERRAAAALLASMIPFTIGLVISIVGGVALGILLGQFWLLEYMLDPFLNALYVIPRVALFRSSSCGRVWSVTGKVVIVDPDRDFPGDREYLFRHQGRARQPDGDRQGLWGDRDRRSSPRSSCPPPCPYIMAGIRLAVGLAIIGIIVAEFFTAITGLGGVIVVYANNFATAKLFVPIIVIGVLGIALSQIVAAIERNLSRWRISERDRF